MTAREMTTTGHEHSPEISQLLRQAKSGDTTARDALFCHLLRDLRKYAGALISRERHNHTLQPSALINEACVRLMRQGVVDNAGNRRQLFLAANRAMRQVLVDHAREKNRQRRGGEYTRLPLDDIIERIETEHSASVESLDEALEKLERQSPRQREVIELRFFSGLTIAETAELMGCSHGTIEMEWRLARAKLHRWLQDA